MNHNHNHLSHLKLRILSQNLSLARALRTQRARACPTHFQTLSLCNDDRLVSFCDKASFSPSAIFHWYTQNSTYTQLTAQRRQQPLMLWTRLNNLTFKKPSLSAFHLSNYYQQLQRRERDQPRKLTTHNAWDPLLKTSLILN